VHNTEKSVSLQESEKKAYTQQLKFTLRTSGIPSFENKEEDEKEKDEEKKKRIPCYFL
jgi:hypothetical protein